MQIFKDAMTTAVAIDRLPTVYQLAADLSISPSTVTRTYRTSQIEGMLARIKCSCTLYRGTELG